MRRHAKRGLGPPPADMVGSLLALEKLLKNPEHKNVRPATPSFRQACHSDLPSPGRRAQLPWALQPSPESEAALGRLGSTRRGGETPGGLPSVLGTASRISSSHLCALHLVETHLLFLSQAPSRSCVTSLRTTLPPAHTIPPPHTRHCPLPSKPPSWGLPGPGPHCPELHALLLVLGSPPPPPPIFPCSHPCTLQGRLC